MSILNKSQTVSPAKHPHSITLLLHASRWEPGMQSPFAHLFCVAQGHCGLNQRFGLIRPKHRFPLVLCPFFVFFSPNKSLLLVACP
ncbi:hypothetical protein GDO81_019132 [Engystomops pustulosus]|uniref:Uncharacterized protein n=1 Tax=Engystomops pustulosus TaxID=76066 RepID=A0AAV6YG18_ENGPU|nr:hypothetical protein GDO81_019132 [Engystomops pustulosus]